MFLGIVVDNSDMRGWLVWMGGGAIRSRGGETAYGTTVSPGLQQLPYLTFLMAMMKKQPMMANAMDVGNAKL